MSSSTSEVSTLVFLKAISDSTKRCHNEQQQENKRMLRLCFVCLKPIDYEMWNASGFWKGKLDAKWRCHKLSLLNWIHIIIFQSFQVPGLGQQLYTCSVHTGKCIFFPHWPGYERWEQWELWCHVTSGLPSHPTVFSAAKGALKTSTECPGWDSSSIFSSHKASFVWFILWLFQG